MTHVTKAGHGAQFDNFGAQATHPHGGAAYDEAFNRMPDGGGHGPQADERYRGNDGETVGVSKSVLKLSAGCPACGHRHSVRDALRATNKEATHKTRDAGTDVRKAVRESDDEAMFRTGTGEPDELREALKAALKGTYGPMLERVEKSHVR